MGLPPKETTILKLPVLSTPDLGSIDISLIQTFSSVLNKQSSPCAEGKTADLDFDKCSLDYFSSYFNKTINCTIPGKFNHSKPQYSKSCKLVFYILLTVNVCDQFTHW